MQDGLDAVDQIAERIRALGFNAPVHGLITGRRDEFEAACAAYAQCVRRGGTLAAAFLVGTSRYIIADRPFPILCLSAEEIEGTFARHATDIEAERIGIVEREIRSGYSGFVFLTGVAR